MWGGSLSLSPTSKQACRGRRLLTLISLYHSHVQQMSSKNIVFSKYPASLFLHDQLLHRVFLPVIRDELKSIGAKVREFRLIDIKNFIGGLHAPGIRDIGLFQPGNGDRFFRQLLRNPGVPDSILFAYIFFLHPSHCICGPSSRRRQRRSSV